MSAPWTAYGWPVPGVFPAAGQCRFRLVHLRGDGIAVMTLGDYRSRGRLEPISPGFNFLSWVVRWHDHATEDGEIVAVQDRAACNDWETASAQHFALLEAWTHREMSE